MSKYVKQLTLEQLAEKLAGELVQVHNDTGLDLGFWETARELVERFYEVRVVVEIGNKRSARAKTRAETETERERNNEQ